MKDGNGIVANGHAEEFRLHGRAVLGRKTKEIVPRLTPASVPILDHENLDRVTAETLVESGVSVVVNAAGSTTGTYPNLGPVILARAGIFILDNVGRDVFERVSEGDEVEVRPDGIYSGGDLVCKGNHLDVETTERMLRDSREAVGVALESFAKNTVEFMHIERDLLFSTLDVPEEISSEIRGRQVLVVVRGYDYRQDLAALGPYLRGVKPFIIAVDGGADAVLEVGRKPDLLFGDMDSVSDRGLKSARHVLVHAYPSGKAPGMERISDSGIRNARTIRAPGLSEDIAILIAEQCGAELIVALGTHVGLVEFLDKGRRGASSTFLTRLKVGARLVDAKGVSKLYPSSVSPVMLGSLVAAGLIAASAIVYSSEQMTDIFNLLAIKLRLLLGV